MKDSTQLAVTRLEHILAANAGNRLTTELMRGMHAAMVEVLVAALETPTNAQLVASGVAEVGNAG